MKVSASRPFERNQLAEVQYPVMAPRAAERPEREAALRFLMYIQNLEPSAPDDLRLHPSVLGRIMRAMISRTTKLPAQAISSLTLLGVCGPPRGM